MVFSYRFISYCMRFLSVLIAVGIFILSSQSKLQPPSSVQFFGADKLIHFCVFALLAFTAGFWIPAGKWNTGPRHCAFLLFSGIAVYGISDELHQYFVPNRSCSAYDWFADCLGAACAAVLWMRMSQKLITFSSPST